MCVIEQRNTVVQINKILIGVKELVKKAASSKEVELFYLPTPTYMGYIVVVNEVEQQKRDLYYVEGYIAKHIEVGEALGGKMDLAGKTAVIKGKEYMNKIYFSKKVNFNSNSQTTRGFIATVNFNAMVEVEEDDEHKGIIKEVEVNQEERI